MRVVVIGGAASYLVNFRGPLMREMVAQGHEVLALGCDDDPQAFGALSRLGVRYERYPVKTQGLNPLGDLRTLVALSRRLGAFSADAVLAYTAKPVIYGMLASRIAGVGTRGAMITGVGSALSGASGARRMLALVTRALYRVGLRQAGVVFFQNPDDEALFRRFRLLGRAQRVCRINGSGVVLDHYQHTELPASGPVTFLMMGRLIRDKGLLEYVEAARLVRHNGRAARFQLLGPLDRNPSAISETQLAAWRTEGVVEYLGTAADVRPYLAAAHVFVLPSYREGTPRSVLEAMAMGRPILTTDAPGCRETVVHGRNGLLVRVGDPASLADAMLRILDSSPGQLAHMGLESRRIAVEKYDVHQVNRVVLAGLELA